MHIHEGKRTLFPTVYSLLWFVLSIVLQGQVKEEQNTARVVDFLSKTNTVVLQNCLFEAFYKDFS